VDIRGELESDCERSVACGACGENGEEREECWEVIAWGERPGEVGAACVELDGEEGRVWEGGAEGEYWEKSVGEDRDGGCCDAENDGFGFEIGLMGRGEEDGLDPGEVGGERVG
jgi:hypothetical protein